MLILLRAGLKGNGNAPTIGNGIPESRLLEVRIYKHCADKQAMILILTMC